MVCLIIIIIIVSVTAVAIIIAKIIITSLSHVLLQLINVLAYNYIYLKHYQCQTDFI